METETRNDEYLGSACSVPFEGGQGFRELGYGRYGRFREAMCPSRGVTGGEVLSWPDGGLALVGDTRAALVLGEGATAQERDEPCRVMYVARYDADGELSSHLFIEGASFRSGSPLPDGTLLVRGTAYQNLSLGEGGEHTVEVDPEEGELSFVVHLDREGRVLSVTDDFQPLVGLEDGGFVAVAEDPSIFLPEGDERRFDLSSGHPFLVRVGSDERLLWARELSGGSPTQAAVAPNGDLLLLGIQYTEEQDQQEPFVFEEEGVTLVPRRDGSICLARFSGEGELRWARTVASRGRPVFRLNGDEISLYRNLYTDRSRETVGDDEEPLILELANWDALTHHFIATMSGDGTVLSARTVWSSYQTEPYLAISPLDDGGYFFAGETTR